VTYAVVFAILGAATGAIYALSALGIVLTYRGSGVVNFASGAIGMLGAYCYSEFRFDDHLVEPIALILALAICGALGTFIHLVLNVRTPSNLTRIVATLAVLIAIQGFVGLGYFHVPVTVPSLLPAVPVVFHNFGVGSDRLILIGIALTATAFVTLFFRWSRLGYAVTAVAENPSALATLGWNPQVIAALAWTFGAVLAGMAGILVAPIFGLSTNLAMFLIVPSLASAVVGSLTSFPLALAGAMMIGILQDELLRWTNVQGLEDAVPFAAVIAVALVRGGRITGRGEAAERLPRVTLASLRFAVPVIAIVGAVLAALVPLSPGWSYAVSVTLSLTIVLESIVVVTGFAGQISLLQWSVSALGALVLAGVCSLGIPYEIAIPLSILATCVYGLVIGLFSLRVRGMTLAIVTLAANVVIIALVFSNPAIVPSPFAISLPAFHLFGLNLDSALESKRFIVFEVAIVALVSLAVMNIRRGRSGRRMLSVRANERAAAALGVSVVGAKVAAFVGGSAIAALGGILFILHYRSPDFSTFDVNTSIDLVGYAVIGGLGFVLGPILGASSVGAVAGSAGGVGAQFVYAISNSAGKYLTLATGVIVLIVTVSMPDGIVGSISQAISRVVRHKPSVTRLSDGDEPSDRTRPQRLEVRGLSVTFGNVRALDDVSFTIEPGQVLGVIGPNGAGKSVLIDTITGFLRPSSGHVELDGHDLAKLKPSQRARSGVGRTFQSLELFADLTVAENLLVGCDDGALSAYLTDVARPGVATLSPEASRAVRDLGLEPHLGSYPAEITFDVRRLVAIARALTSNPGVLLLDEPAASLDERERGELSLLISKLAHDLGVAVLLVEHDVDLVAAVSDQMLALDLGRIIATGRPEQVRTAPEVVRAYVGESVEVPVLPGTVATEP
jgi:sulfate-transporting ATPase